MEPSIEITYDPTIKVRGITEELFKQQPEGKFVLKPFTIISKKVYKTFHDRSHAFNYLLKFLKKKSKEDKDFEVHVFSEPKKTGEKFLISLLLNDLVISLHPLIRLVPFKYISSIKNIIKKRDDINKIFSYDLEKKIRPSVSYLNKFIFLLMYLFSDFLLPEFFTELKKIKMEYFNLFLNLRIIFGIILGVAFINLMQEVEDYEESFGGRQFKIYLSLKNLFSKINKLKRNSKRKTILLLNLEIDNHFDPIISLKVIKYLYASVNKNISIFCHSQNSEYIKYIKSELTASELKDTNFFIEDIKTKNEVRIINNSQFNEENLPIFHEYYKYQQEQKELQLKNVQLERENKEQLARLIQSAKLESMNIATSGLAHEIRNPLGIIQLVIENLRIEKNLNKEILTEDLDKIKTQVSRIYKLTETFQKYSSKGNLTPKSIDSQIENSLRFFEQRLLSNKIEVNYDKPSDDVAKILFSEELSIVIENLISNSIDALEGNKDATITIQINAEKNQLQILFTDNGHGFSEDIKKEIFTPLFTTKGPGKGTGLGLWLCHTIVKDSLKGDIRVDSKLDEGTTFTILLPVNGDADV